MGAFFAGAIRAPITSILIIFEMTGDYAIILPLMISNVISYTVAVRLHPVPIYDALLQQDGVPMPEHQTHRDLRALTVEQAMRTDSLSPVFANRSARSRDGSRPRACGRVPSSTTRDGYGAWSAGAS